MGLELEVSRNNCQMNPMIVRLAGKLIIVIVFKVRPRLALWILAISWTWILHERPNTDKMSDVKRTEQCMLINRAWRLSEFRPTVCPSASIFQ